MPTPNSMYGLNIMKIRPADNNDSLDILLWRNDSLTRAMSRNQKMIDTATHNQWYENVLKNKNSLLLIGTLSSEAIGMVRFDKLENTNKWEVSITIAPAHRSKGLSVLLLSSALTYLTNRFPESSFIADIKKDNLCSVKLFEKLGFGYLSSTENMLHYFKN